MKRNMSDYVVLGILSVVLMILFRNSPLTPVLEGEEIMRWMDPLNVCPAKGGVCMTFWMYLVTVGSLFFFETAIFKIFTKNLPTTKDTLFVQFKTLGANFIILPIYQAFFEYLTFAGWTKATTGRLGIGEILLDLALYTLWFEILWYAGHRSMHDSKILWKYGHAFHHTFNKPEMLNLMTNFTFDHVVEPFILMFCAFLPAVFYPCNYMVLKFVQLVFMILAIFAHWDDFPYRYHLNHHYYVTNNFGSHVPIFDWLFGTLNMKPPKFSLEKRNPSVTKIE